ncbi:peptidase domain-containing ABC transporter [Chondromyces crocatus]|uniref:Cyclolysin secretion/processing ATP-binding protein CyaB n=1 Tax=Chondromyces crocatus TaxID=52 RepID=A0A0K1EGU1_CHOCO|nr:ABC transporter ATP-binding protein [Chondromyces crocatus]AKT39917.1 cyclolysin secretion/processing ATP-binding protein CyaB [Chondromyces crocatus]
MSIKASEPPVRPTRHAIFRQLAALILLLRPYWWSLIKGALLGPAIGLTSMAAPYLTKLLFDDVAVSHDVGLMKVLVAGIFAASLAALLAESLLGYYSSYLHIKIENTAVLHLFNHLQHLPDAFFYRRQSGDILSRFQDMKSGLAIVASLLRLLFGQGIYVLLVPPFLIALQWKLALVAVVTVPLTALIPLTSGRILGGVWEETVRAYADFESLQVETLRQIRTHKTLALERFAFVRARAQVDTILAAHLRTQTTETGLRVVERVLDATGMALFTWLGWRLILAGEMSLGDYVAFVAYVGYLRGPFIDAVGFLFSLQQRAVNLHRVFEHLDHPPEQDPAGAMQAREVVTKRLLGRIRLEGVSFGYTAGAPVLANVDASVEPGRVIAVVGPSGSGKTTLLRLLLRLEDPQQGRVLFDGRDARDIPLSDLRRQIAVVWQDVELYRGTLRHNLEIGLDGVTDAALEDVVRRSGLESVVASAPKGYETMVAEWGASLSGGQRQRLAIGRALLREAPILLLDEATSNIDVETEALIVGQLFDQARRRGKTVLFVTHRLSNAALADEVWVVSEGCVEARGTHPELLQTSPLYQRLHRLSTGTASLAGDEMPEERVA